MQPLLRRFPRLRLLREVHPGGISVPIVPGLSVGQSPSSNRFTALTEIDPMEDDHPHHVRVVAAPRLRLRLMSQPPDIMADPHVSDVSGSDTKRLKERCLWWMLQTGPLVLGGSRDDG